MIGEISLILLLFKDCFSRVAAFNWFVVIIMGFIVRLDHHGVTSMIRWLNLDSSLYTALLSFFRASSWQLPRIQKRWQQIVLSLTPMVTINGRFLIAGDGIKISKEAKKCLVSKGFTRNLIILVKHHIFMGIILEPLEFWQAG